jgi:hypothetical protein
MFYSAYLNRYLELHPGVTRDEITSWMIPVAAGRLKEDIPGEKEQLLKLIQSQLPLQNKQPDLNIQG